MVSIADQRCRISEREVQGLRPRHESGCLPDFVQTPEYKITAVRVERVASPVLG